MNKETIKEDFNSIKVRLKRMSDEELESMTGHFNSIKVRLKPLPNWAGDRYLSLFQFHKGTIKTGGWWCSSVAVVSPFQFHKGTIKTRAR